MSTIHLLLSCPDEESDDAVRTIPCPNCGSPAEVQGDRWECGYCGDTGYLG